jgi:hypothetical protein
LFAFVVGGPRLLVLLVGLGASNLFGYPGVRRDQLLPEDSADVKVSAPVTVQALVLLMKTTDLFERNVQRSDGGIVLQQLFEEYRAANVLV